MWEHKEIRETFIKFFVERGHKYVRSSSLIPKDPSLLFTIAGMVQFKPYWSGIVEPPFPRATSVQKCLRVNDLENVGKTIRHNTFFEMLGNFSFGDYFKREAIKWAWELITEVYKIDKGRLSVSVYEEDEEAYNIWRDEVGLPEDKIYRLGADSNFWGPAGGAGACGPSSEIFYDMGEKFKCEREDCGPDCDCDRFIEVWNIVFPQYNQLRDGTREPLKNRGIDTGMGMERLTMVLQKKDSIFTTDLFYPIITAVEELSGGRYETNPIPFNIIADHIRALTFAISDGVIPSNEERGYVLRRILRRALRAGNEIGFEEPFLYKLVGVVVDIMGDVYPEIKEKPDFVSVIIKAEEERFLKTLSSGLSIIKEIMDKHSEDRKVSGAEAFKLYDTYGFPFDMTKEILKEKGYDVDEEEFHLLLEKRREESREYQKFQHDTAEFNIMKEGEQVFVGYDTLEVETEILMWRKRGDIFELILEKTPFYAESGGQVGDRGIIEGRDFKMEVMDTVYSGPYRVCSGKIKGEIRDRRVVAKVDRERRKETERAHTATHLLHAALRKLVGEYAKQQGSLVEPGRLRFDFNAFSSVKDKIRDIEEYVYENILKDIEVEKFYTSLKEAISMGAIALFEEEYGDRVRVVKIDGVSMELCGGTHLDRTGEIGFFKIVSESAVSSGVRRIEALVGKRAQRYIEEREETMAHISTLIHSSPEKLKEDIKDIMERLSLLEKRVSLLSREIRNFYFEMLKNTRETIGNYNFYSLNTSILDIEYLRELSDKIREFDKNSVGFFVSLMDGMKFILFRGESVPVNMKKLTEIIRGDIKGGGGGRDDFVQGGGKDREGWQKALRRIKDYLKTH